MKLTIQAIHFTAADRLKDFISKKVNKLDHFFDRIIEGEVVLKVRDEFKEGNKYAEVMIHVPGQTLVASEHASSFEAAVDQATVKLKTQIKRYKGKMRAHA
ncbi:MAG: ribosome-associated translation inhibitor RaiA [Bacteroidia bacterium]|nr:ribosome-associated translation inhibitor RaiA [Bacteroidia bacterium]